MSIKKYYFQFYIYFVKFQLWRKRKCFGLFKYFKILSYIINSPIVWHDINGFPVKPGLQPQIGLWFLTRHIALIPHVPEHGSLHFWFKHASFKLQSEFTMHSGLQ